jgi:two-component system chemotaxis response regulator CheB
VVAVAASAGGVEALREFVSLLPADFPAAVLVVLHIPPAGPSVLPRILSRSSKLPARHPVDGEPLAGGVITVAPPDRHLVVDDGITRLLAVARENGHRPSADVLLRSVAQDFGTRGAGVVLSGTMDDGAAGLRAIGTAGGLTLVQDPAEASFPGMPTAAIEEAGPRFVGPVVALAHALLGWLEGLGDAGPGLHPGTGHPAATAGPGAVGNPGTGDPVPAVADPVDATALTCPECGGTLYEHDVYGAERLRCRVGHTFSLGGLALGKRETLEKALWAAVVALEEQADVSRRIIKRLSASGRPSQVKRYRDDIAVTEQRIAALTGLIHELVEHPSADGEEEANGVGAPTER